MEKAQRLLRKVAPPSSVAIKFGVPQPRVCCYSPIAAALERPTRALTVSGRNLRNAACHNGARKGTARVSVRLLPEHRPLPVRVWTVWRTRRAGGTPRRPSGRAVGCAAAADGCAAARSPNGRGRRRLGGEGRAPVGSAAVARRSIAGARVCAC